jgi:anti-sigma-K factor RskA
MRWEQIVAALSAAAVLVLGLFSYSLARRLDDRNRALALQDRMIAGISSPLAVTVPMVAAGSAVNASGRIFVAADRHSGGLVATGLSDPGKRVYQLWLIVDNQPSPLEAFRPDENGNAYVPIAGDLGSMQAMAVTLEQHPNLSKPQGGMVLRTA